jgi:hypothetical protein
VGFAHQFTGTVYPIPDLVQSPSPKVALANELRLSVSLQNKRSEYGKDHQYNGGERNLLRLQKKPLLETSHRKPTRQLRQHNELERFK